MKQSRSSHIAIIGAMLLSAACSAQPENSSRPHPITCEQMRIFSALEMDFATHNSAQDFTEWASKAPGLAGLPVKQTVTEAGDEVDIALPGGGLVGATFGSGMRRHVTFLTQKAITMDLEDVIVCLGQPEYYLVTGPVLPNDRTGVEVELYYTNSGVMVTALRIPSTAGIVGSQAIRQLPIISIVRMPAGQVADFYANYYWRNFGGRTSLLKHIKPWPGDILKMVVTTTN